MPADARPRRSPYREEVLMEDAQHERVPVAATNGPGQQREHHRQRRRRRYRRRRRRLQAMSVMPTLFTLGNLVAGFAAIHYAAKPPDVSGPWNLTSLTVAGALVFLGMLLDAVDGSVARLTRSMSDMGAQLDSLADLITFGVAPAFMMLRLVTPYVVADEAAPIIGPEADHQFARVLWGIAAVYVCCTALRLARFNVETPTAAVEDHLLFRGLPSPGAAGAVASLIILHQSWVDQSVAMEDVSLIFARWTAFGIPFATLLCAVAMVSSIPYVHFLNRYVRGRRSFGYVVRLVVPVFLAIWWFQETLAFAFTLYALYSPLRITNLRVRRWRHARRLARAQA
ncbi:MAG: CDP-alcohol phosphatidyltransferase family protein [Planctomycetota bacterium]|jgi:CDP-diacylglycerol--serine O-phosphatidyltransferase